MLTCCVFCSRPVTQIEFSDAATLVSASLFDGTMRLWDVDTGTQKARGEMEGWNFALTQGSDETVGKYVIIATKGNLVTVRKTEAPYTTVSFFRAPMRDQNMGIRSIRCTGDQIAVCCNNKEKLHLKLGALLVHS